MSKKKDTVDSRTKGEKEADFDKLVKTPSKKPQPSNSEKHRSRPNAPKTKFKRSRGRKVRQDKHKPISETMQAVMNGAAAGCVATVPMTAAMVVAHGQLPWHHRYSLPPRQITSRVVHDVGIWNRMDSTQKSATTLVAHFSYGAAMGAIYGVMVGNNPAKNSSSRGLLFGIGVWSVSYLGILPGLGILSPATQHPMKRNALMIGSHVIWGLCLAGALRLIKKPRGHVRN